MYRLTVDVKVDGSIEIWNGNHKVKYCASRGVHDATQDQQTMANVIGNAMCFFTRVSSMMYMRDENTSFDVYRDGRTYSFPKCTSKKKAK